MEKLKVKIRNTITVKKSADLDEKQVEELIARHYRIKMALAKDYPVTVEFDVASQGFLRGVTVSHESVATEDDEVSL